MGGQIVTLYVGQCGVQLASACWELYCLEHCLSPEGRIFLDSQQDDFSYYNFFSESVKGQFVPRALIIDLEPTTIDEIKIGSYRNLFSHRNLINGMEDAANNFARGFYGCGRTIIPQIVERTRKLVEACNNVQAFIIHHSLGGGTGSGLTSLMLEYMCAEYPFQSKVEFGVFPSPTLSVAIVEPYNAVLALHTPMENADLVAFFENESLFSICSKKLCQNAPLYTHLNRMTAQVISGMTASMRFEGPIQSNLIDFQTNLVPYPRIHFPIISFSPFLSQNQLCHQSLSVKELTLNVNNKGNQMAEVNPDDGAYMSCCLLYRGDVSPREVNNAIAVQKDTRSCKWVDWCPTGYKVGINYQPMTVIPSSGIAYSSRALTFLCNSTAIKTVVSRINQKFVMLFDRKSFIHWYVGEGMEEEEFKESLDDVLTLQKDYEVLEENAAVNSAFGSENRIRSEKIEKNRKEKSRVKGNQNNFTDTKSESHFKIQNKEISNNLINQTNDHTLVLSLSQPSLHQEPKKSNNKNNCIDKIKNHGGHFKSMIDITYDRLGNKAMEYAITTIHQDNNPTYSPFKNRRSIKHRRPSLRGTRDFNVLPKCNDSGEQLINTSNCPQYGKQSDMEYENKFVSGKGCLFNPLFKSDTEINADTFNISKTFTSCLKNFGVRKKSGMYRSSINTGSSTSNLYRCTLNNRIDNKS